MKEPDDLNRAIGLTMEALESVDGDDDSLRSRCELVLGDLFGRRFQRDNALCDMEEALKYVESAVSRAEGASLRAERLVYLARFLCLGFVKTQSKEYITRAVAVYENVVEGPTISPRITVNAALSLGALLENTDLGKAGRFYTLRLDFLPLLSSPTLERRTQQIRLSQISGLGCLAASVSLACAGDIYEAIRLCEVGKNVLATKLLDFRSDLTSLENMHPCSSGTIQTYPERF